MSDNYYDCMHRVWTILKESKDTTFIIKSRMYKVESSKLYIYYCYKWILKPLISFKKEKLFEFEIDLKKVLGIIER